MKREALCAAFVIVAGTLGSSATALGEFQTFQGNGAVEQTWRNAAGGGGPIPLEDFESFHGSVCCSGPSDAIQHLSSLRINLYGAAPNTYPGIYAYAPQAHSGANQISNFNAGGAQFSDYFFEPESGLSIRALGIWQCDPQGNVVFEAYDAGNMLVGSITALINNGSGNSFAGFISDVPIMKVRVRGDEGDGYNHTDDWQIVTAPVSGMRTIVQWRSVRAHGGAGDLPIVLTAAATGDAGGPAMPTTETRQGGIQKVEVVFDGSVTLADLSSIVVSGPCAPTFTATTAGNVLSIHFTGGMLDQACYTITLGPATLTQPIGGDHDCIVRSLVGDTTGNGTLNLSDVVLTSKKVAASLAASAAPQYDVNLSGGTIDTQDMIAIKSLVSSPAHQAACP